jgi:hypothetical protein
MDKAHQDIIRELHEYTEKYHYDVSSDMVKVKRQIENGLVWFIIAGILQGTRNAFREASDPITADQPSRSIAPDQKNYPPS